MFTLFTSEQVGQVIVSTRTASAPCALAEQVVKPVLGLTLHELLLNAPHLILEVLDVCQLGAQLAWRHLLTVIAVILRRDVYSTGE
jgi:hypothetical protein